MDRRFRARQLAAAAAARNDSTGWFEELYREAQAGEAVVPWDDRRPNSHLVEWFERQRQRSSRALVVGCGLGDDADWLAVQGIDVTAFDISPTAIDMARRRFPSSATKYQAADLLHLPAGWSGAFDLVFEANTLQVLPSELRPAAIVALAGTVAEGGTLLVVCRGRDEDDDSGQMPWPLLRSELDALAGAGLETLSFEDFFDDEDPPVRRFRLVGRR